MKADDARVRTLPSSVKTPDLFFSGWNNETRNSHIEAVGVEDLEIFSQINARTDLIGFLQRIT